VQGNANGDLATTQFSRPNGITISADGTSLVVGSVSPQNYIKKMRLVDLFLAKFRECPSLSDGSHQKKPAGGEYHGSVRRYRWA